jgi:hypothetical protein
MSSRLEDNDECKVVLVHEEEKRNEEKRSKEKTSEEKKSKEKK